MSHAPHRVDRRLLLVGLAVVVCLLASVAVPWPSGVLAGHGWLTAANEAAAQPATQSLDIPVAASSDDAEESPSGAVWLTSSDLELVTKGTAVRTVGLRFPGVTVPRRATVTRAYVQFQVDEVSTGQAALRIQGQAADTAATFTTATRNVSSRTRTAASVPWSPVPTWPTVGVRGVDQQTPDLSPVIQEIVGRSGWASGNALALIVTGSGQRTAEARDAGAALAPVLHMEYQSFAAIAPFAETPEVGSSGDRADDVAIGSGQYMVGTDKDPTRGGLEVYTTTTAARVSRLGSLGDTDNVDVRSWGGSDLYAASNRADNDIVLYRLNSAGVLSEVGRLGTQSDLYGNCLGLVNGRLYAYATSDDGVVEQYEINASGTSGTKLGQFDNGGITEACAVDDQNGWLYASEEDRGLRKRDAVTLVFLATVDVVGAGGYLVADVEGVGIADDGYIVVSSQGESLVNVYDRAPPHAFRGDFDVTSGSGIDDTTQTDGLDVDLGKDLLVVHDYSTGGGSNHKLVRWSAVKSGLGLS